MLGLQDLWTKLPPHLLPFRIPRTANISFSHEPSVPQLTDLIEVSGPFRFIFSSWLKHPHDTRVKKHNKTRCRCTSPTNPFLNIPRTLGMPQQRCSDSWTIQLHKRPVTCLFQVLTLIWNSSMTGNWFGVWIVRCKTSCWSFASRSASTSRLHICTHLLIQKSYRRLLVSCTFLSLQPSLLDDGNMPPLPLYYLLKLEGKKNHTSKQQLFKISWMLSGVLTLGLLSFTINNKQTELLSDIPFFTRKIREFVIGASPLLKRLRSCSYSGASQLNALKQTAVLLSCHCCLHYPNSSIISV